MAAVSPSGSAKSLDTRQYEGDDYTAEDAPEESAMGEVRVRVVITNATDLGMLRRKLMKPSQIRKVEADALVDIGAVSLVLPPAVADRLGLQRPYTHVAEYADGRREEVGVTESVLVELMHRHT